MRRAIFLAFFIFVTIAPVLAESVLEAEVLFAEAAEAYRNAKYDEAVQAGEKILSMRIESPQVYYNLANSYFKSGKTGKAVLNYIRAKDLAPRDADIRANLRFARALVVNGKSNAVPSRFSRVFLSDHFSSDELKWLAFFFFAFAGVFFLAHCCMKTKSRRIMAGGVVLGMFWVFFLMGSVMKMANVAGRAVCTSSTEARFEPSAQATVYFKLSEGAEVKVLREKDGWQKIQRSDDKIGWVPLDATERI